MTWISYPKVADHPISRDSIYVVDEITRNMTRNHQGGVTAIWSDAVLICLLYKMNALCIRLFENKLQRGSENRTCYGWNRVELKMVQFSNGIWKPDHLFSFWMVKPTFKNPVFEWFRFSNLRFSDPHCTFKLNLSRGLFQRPRMWDVRMIIDNWLK